MAKTSLRAYHKEIANLIDRGQTDEAIAHCKYILKLFPKHIDTYRLLGKAYLEAQRFSEATDIFQRVLAVVPDDFVAHVGMSIIREDEADLDAAIWHMERAFEVQPSKATVQDELKRLYGRRDGVEPPKLRLTRGALIRMYERGELFSQAIAEARAALQEDAQRSDIEVILARLFFNSGQKVEATEICSRLVAKNPYIFEANRILAETLPGTTKAEDAKKYLQRAAAIDPYYAYVSANVPLVNMVPDNAVVLERLDYTSSGDFSNSPNWAQNVGADLQVSTEVVPDWLGTTEGTNTTEPSFSPNESPPQSSFSYDSTPVEPVVVNENEPLPPRDAAGSEIPDWMRQAGWIESTPEVVQQVESTQSNISDVGSNNEPEVAPGIVPDWLSSLAPEGALQTQSEPVVEERLDVLASLFPQSTTEQPISTEAPMGESSTTIPEIAPAITQSPAWLAEPAAVPTQSIPEVPVAHEWVNEFTQEPPASSSSQEEIPEWMIPGRDETIQVVRPQGIDSLDWMKSLEGSENPPTETPTLSAEASEWIASAADTGPLSGLPPSDTIQTDKLALSANQPQVPAPSPIQQVNEVYPPSQQDEAMAWLESLAAKQGADEGTLLSKPDERVETTPDWIAQMQTDQIVPEPVIEAAQIDIPVIPASDEEDTMAWLKSFAGEQESDRATLLPLPEETQVTSPKWASNELEMQPDVLPPTSDEPLPDWLASDDFGKKSEQQLSPTIIPQWADQPPIVDNIVPEAVVETPGVPETLPDWMVSSQEFAAAQKNQQPDVEPLLESVLPEWMAAIGKEETEYPVIPTSGETIPEQPLEITQSTDLQETTEPDLLPTHLEEVISSMKEPVIPDEDVISLEGMNDVSPVGVGDIGQQYPIQEQTQDDAFAWLESLAARQGADEGTLIIPPEARKEEPPEWVVEQAAQTPEANDEVLPEIHPIDQPVESVPLEPLPIWLASDEVAPIETAQAQTLPGSEEIFPEWISSVPVLAADQSTEDSAPLMEEEIELPDWLKDAEMAEPIPIDEIRQTEVPVDEQIYPILPVLDVIQPDYQPVDVFDELDSMNETPFQIVADESGQIPAELVEELSPKQIMAEAATVAFDRSEVMTELAKLNQSSSPTTVSAPPEIRELLSLAQASLNQGNIEQAVNCYNKLIESETFLEDVIHDLRNALYRFPVDIALWLTLGDAYVRNHNLQEALDAYTKAEEFLK
jgi:tetratricopeptide (TPR) repeat protein